MLTEVAQAAQDYLNTPPGVGDQITAAALSAWVIQRAKCSNLSAFGWINTHSAEVNRLVSFGFAIFSTVGIHAFFERTAEHAGVLTVTGIPSFGEVLPLIWKIAGSFVMQEGWYRGFIKHEEGQKAVDKVAETITEHKEEIAAAAVEPLAVQDKTRMLPNIYKEAPKVQEKSKKTEDWSWLK